MLIIITSFQKLDKKNQANFIQTRKNNQNQGLHLLVYFLGDSLSRPGLVVYLTVNVRFCKCLTLYDLSSNKKTQGGGQKVIRLVTNVVRPKLHIGANEFLEWHLSLFSLCVLWLIDKNETYFESNLTFIDWEIISCITHRNNNVYLTNHFTPLFR